VLDERYTPERLEGALARPIDARPRKVALKKRFEETERAVKEGRVLGPFTSSIAAMRALERERRACARRSH